MRIASPIGRYCRGGRAALTLVIIAVAVAATTAGIVDDATDSRHLGAAVFATLTAALLSIIRRFRQDDS